MARLVLGVGTPHTPWYPKQVRDEGPTSHVGALFRKVADEVEAAHPDLLLVFHSDHFVNYFFDNMPAFACGILDQAPGPAESWVEMPRSTLKGHEPFARGLLAFALQEHFDVASSEEMVLEHGVMVPLHFLTPRMDVPIVPLHLRGLTVPLLTAQRCLDFGRMVRRFIDRWPGQERVVVLGSGSFSFDVGGPKMGWTDTAWSETVVGHLRRGQIDDLVACATTERMLEAGNVSGELLCWIAMLGAVGDVAPAFVEPNEGEAYAAWRIDGQ